MSVELRILGEPAIANDGVLDVPTSRRLRALIALLSLGGSRGVRMDDAIEALWPDADPDAARRHLRVLVSSLRARLADPSAGVASRDGAYVPVGVEVDVDGVRRSIDEARASARSRAWHEAADHLQHALGRWRGPSLGGIADEPWARAAARELDAVRHEAVVALADAWLAAERPELVVDLVADAEAEASVELLERRARACARTGRLDQAAACCAEAIRAAAAADVPRLQVLQRAILEHDEEVVGRPRPRGAQLPPPPPLDDSFVGRRVELAALRAEIRAGARAITLLGPGGTGKTRLANELARRLDGVVEAVGWVDLTRVASASAVPGLLLGAFGITGGSDDPLDAIGQAIGTRRLLLVLDNAEHVVEVASVVAELERRCPRLMLVVTSRIELGVATTVVRLQPLPADAGAGLHADTVQLFLDRARAVDGLVDERSETIAAIADVCAAVDRLPLGIELAAARTSLLPPAKLLVALRRRFDLLRTRHPGAPDRQRSLLELVAWSYDLLDDDARRVLQTASTFAGGWTLGDLVTVDGEVTAADAASLLQVLASSSLVVSGAGLDGEPRWRMLDTIATFARRRLDETAGGAARRARHAHLMLEVARAANTHRPEAAPARSRLVTELANVHAAIDWCIAHDPPLAADIFGSMRHFYATLGAHSEAVSIGRRVAAVVSNARSHHVLGSALHYTGAAAEAETQLARAVQIARDEHLWDLLVFARFSYAEALRARGDVGAALRVIDEAEAEARDDHGRALSMMARGLALAEAGAGLGRVPVLRAALEGLERTGDELWSIAAEVQVAIAQILEGGDLSALPVVTEAVNRLNDGGYRTHATYVRAAYMRALAEHELDAELERGAAAWLDEIRAGGNALNLLFALASASLPLVRRQAASAWSVATEALTLARATSTRMLIEYPLLAIALLAEGAGDSDFAVASVRAIDASNLDDGYRLDRWASAHLAGLAGRVGASAVDGNHDTRRFEAVVDLLQARRLRGSLDGLAPTLETIDA